MRYQEIKTSKFRPKHPARKKKGKTATFSPRPLKAGRQHIGTEQLPESIGTTAPNSSRQNLRTLDRD